MQFSTKKNNKASGPDEICAEILKTSFDYICPFLLKLYNRIFNRAEYPRDWGTSIITPIYKGGNKNIASNYRGITLTNILAKIYSQILLNRLNSWTDKHEKISNCQFGFQKGKSTVDCIFIFHSIVCKMLNSGKKVYAAFLDYEKCFDKINRLFLFQKLIAQNVSCKMINAIKAMYSTVRSYIRCNNETSDFIRSDTGVKQGDPSSPLLAMMFMNDIINYINSDIEGIVTINELKLFILLYADDQVIFSSSAISLQSMINDVQNYCDMWGLKINPGKSKIMIFEKGNKATHYTFYLYGNEIEVVSSFKYLGVVFFKNANWYRTQKCISEQANLQLHRLFCVFQEIELPFLQKCKIFDTLVTPILNYSSEVWGMHHGKNIENVHIKVCRRILNVRNSTNILSLYGELGRIPFAVMRKLNMIKYWIKLLKQDNRSVTRTVYEMLRSDAEINVNYNKKIGRTM